MKNPSYRDTLTIDEDIQFQKLSWKVERIGWVLFLVFLGVSFLGFTGFGPLNEASAKQGNLAVNFKPFSRQLTPTQLEIHSTQKSQNEKHIWIDRSFLDNYQIQQTIPEPERIVVNKDKLEYVFVAPDDTFKVIFDLQPNGPGIRSGRIGQETGEVVTIRQLIYP